MVTKEELAKKMGQMSWVQLVEKPELITIEALWRLYAEHAFKGKEVSAIQYSETKKAFFIGFGECFKLMTDFAGDLPEEKACELFTSIARQITEFNQAVLQRDFVAKS